MSKPKASTYKRLKTWAPEVRLAQGPQAMGDTGGGSYHALYGYAWALILDRAENRPRHFQAQVPGEGPWALSDSRGPEVAVWVEEEIPPIPHDPREIRHIALYFDQSARHVVAYERNGEVWVRQWDPITQVFVMRGPFPGADPVLIQDSTVGFYPPDSDVLLFHLSPDRTRLVMRIQREQFGVEHVVQAFNSPALLDQAIALPYQLELLGSLSDPESTGMVVRSDLYPFRASDALGTTSFSAPSTGEYVPIVIVRDLGAEGLGTAAFSAPSTGDYIPVVIVRDLGADDLGSASFSAPSTGGYALVVVVHDLTQVQYSPPDLLGTATMSAPQEGSYDAA